MCVWRLQQALQAKVLVEGGAANGPSARAAEEKQAMRAEKADSKASKLVRQASRVSRQASRQDLV